MDEISMVRTGLDAESSTRTGSGPLDEDKLEIKGSYSTKVQPSRLPPCASLSHDMLLHSQSPAPYGQGTSWQCSGHAS